MKSYSIEQTGYVPISIDDAIKRHKNEAKYQTIVLEMAMIDKNEVWFDQHNQQKYLRDLLLELVCQQIDGREETDDVDQKGSNPHVDLQSFRLIASLDAHRIGLDALVDFAENV